MYKYAISHLFATFLISGCVSNMSISLEENVRIYPNIEITDLRDKKDKKTSFPNNSRQYGDNYIEPSKLAYLNYILGESLANDKELKVKLEAYTTTEYIPTQLKNITELATASAVVAVAGGRQTYRRYPTASDDKFVLILKGYVNDRPFDIYYEFSHADIKHSGFPGGSPVYRERIKTLHYKAAGEIIDLAF